MQSSEETRALESVAQPCCSLAELEGGEARNPGGSPPVPRANLHWPPPELTGAPACLQAAAYLRGLPMLSSLFPQAQHGSEAATLLFGPTALPPSPVASTPLRNVPSCSWGRAISHRLCSLSPNTLHTCKPGRMLPRSPEASDWVEWGP